MARKKKRVAKGRVPSGGGRGRRSKERRILAGKAFRALVVFLVTLVVLVALYFWYNTSGYMVALSRFTAVATAWVLNLFGEQAAV